MIQHSILESLLVQDIKCYHVILHYTISRLRAPRLRAPRPRARRPPMWCWHFQLFASQSSREHMSNTACITVIHCHIEGYRSCKHSRIWILDRGKLQGKRKEIGCNMAPLQNCTMQFSVELVWLYYNILVCITIYCVIILYYIICYSSSLCVRLSLSGLLTMACHATSGPLSS